MQTRDDVVVDPSVAFHHAVQGVVEPIGEFLNKENKF
jgi:hypothetical protein